MRVAVVMVTIDSLDDVRQSLGDLRRQSGVELELVVVDNGSSDGTADFLREQPDVNLIANAENRWLSPAWAQGVEASTAPFLLFLNPDMHLPDTALIRGLAAALEAEPEAALAGPRLFDGEGGDRVNGAYGWPTVRWLVLEALGLTRPLGLTRRPASAKAADGGTRPVGFVNGSCMLVRRSALDAIGGIDVRYPLYWEELDLARRLGRAGFRILLAPSVSAVHRGKGAPALEGVRAWGWSTGERLYFRTHHGRAALAVVVATQLVKKLRRYVRGRWRSRISS